MTATTAAQLTDTIGYTVGGVVISSNQSDLGLVLLLEGKPPRSFCLSTYGDCCSESWWADVIGVKQLLGARITDASDIPMPQVEDDRSRQEVDQIYGIRICTDKGACDLVFRNSSNGYYGGGYTPIWGREISSNPTLLTEDWSA